MNTGIEGFYVGYFSATSGNGMVLFCITSNAIAGADLTTKFDGSYYWNELKNVFEGQMKVTLKPGSISVQGVPAGPHGLAYDVSLLLPRDFAAQPYVHFNTPLGPVNARFEKIRDL